MSICHLTSYERSKKAGKRCHKCGREIVPPEGYRWWQARYGPKNIRCLREECYPQVWERESNPLRSDHIHADHLVGVAQQAGTAEEAVDALESANDLVNGLIESLDERISNYESGNMEHIPAYDACQNSKDELETWVSNAEDWIGSLEFLMEEDEDRDDIPTLEDVLGEIEDLPDLDIG